MLDRITASLPSLAPAEQRVAQLVLDDPRAAHRMCGYLSDFFGLYDALTVRQCLTYMAWCQGMKSDDIGARIDELTSAIATQLIRMPVPP
jgi:ABC-type Na+ transport system ATPase subunit NatA